MKILHIVPVNSQGELPTFLQHQIESLNTYGVDSEIVRFRGSNIRFTSPTSSFASVLRLVKLVNRADADLIHAHWGSVLGFIVSLARNPRIPFLLTLRGSDVNRVPTERAMLYRVRRWFTKIAAKRADHVIYVSANLIRPEHRTSMKFSVIPDGTPIRIFSPLPKDQARTLLGWDQKSRYIIFHCGNRPLEKNLRLANEVIHLLQQKIDGLNFIVFESNLTQEELATNYSAADLLLFTSHAEGSPNTVREAIACGCPVVSVAVGDVHKWIGMSGTGAICGYDSAQLSGQAYESMISGNRADNRIAHKYSVESMAIELMRVYQLLR